jgi:hypothetical protein
MTDRKATFLKQFKNLSFAKKGINLPLTNNIPIQKDKEMDTFKKIFLAVIFINLALIGTVVLLRKNLPPEVPLLYGMPEGETQLVKTIFLTLPAFLTIFFSIINFLISIFVKEKFARQILIYSLIFLSFFSLVSIAKIIFLVGNI